MNKDIYECLKQRVGINKTKKGGIDLRQREKHGRSPETGNSFVCLGNFSLNPKEGSGRN